MTRRLLLALAALALLAGCSSVSKSVSSGVSTMMSWVGLGPDRVELRSLRVIAEPDANQDSATRLDLVLVYDAKAEELLPKTAPEWFDQKRALLDGVGSRLGVVSLELPPGTVVDPVALPDGYRKALAARVYAGYQAKSGQHPIALTAIRNAVLRLGNQKISVISEP
ncbi:hypothetical protein [Chitinimonas koreensis]|uniref:hypothetical protein n=1 Tax=Chitinimonas koreensis TaxID=356302 RepID=UPI000684F96D|nr:hypothetical protein [Chitinimonas koreensis]QNM95341.1 hypothetical protein H9L41_15885 [Chitinimonas koreensis]